MAKLLPQNDFDDIVEFLRKRGGAVVLAGDVLSYDEGRKMVCFFDSKERREINLSRVSFEGDNADLVRGFVARVVEGERGGDWGA